MSEIEENRIRIYQMPDSDSDEDEDFKEQNKQLKVSSHFWTKIAPNQRKIAAPLQERKFKAWCAVFFPSYSTCKRSTKKNILFLKYCTTHLHKADHVASSFVLLQL